MLASGAMPLLEEVHGERVKVLDGVDRGRWFVAIKENETDLQLSSPVVQESFGKRMLRFTDRPGNVPSVNTKKLVKLQTLDGKKWAATRQDNSAYLSVDFELVQLVD